MRAVALGVLAPVINESGFRPYFLVRRPRFGAAAITKGQILVKGVLDASETRELGLRGETLFKDLPDRLQTRIDVIRRNDYDLVQFTSAPDYRSRQDLPDLLSRMREEGPYAFVFNKDREQTTPSQLYAVMDRD